MPIAKNLDAMSTTWTDTNGFTHTVTTHRRIHDTGDAESDQDLIDRHESMVAFMQLTYPPA